MIYALVCQYYFRYYPLSAVYFIHMTFRKVVIHSYSGDCTDKYIDLRLVATTGTEPRTISEVGNDANCNCLFKNRT